MRIIAVAPSTCNFEDQRLRRRVEWTLSRSATYWMLKLSCRFWRKAISEHHLLAGVGARVGVGVGAGVGAGPVSQVEQASEHGQTSEKSAVGAVLREKRTLD